MAIFISKTEVGDQFDEYSISGTAKEIEALRKFLDDALNSNDANSSFTGCEVVNDEEKPISLSLEIFLDENAEEEVVK